MVISKVFPILLRCNYAVNLINSQRILPARHLAGILNADLTYASVLRKMSTNIDAEVNNTSRHLDYQQLMKKLENKGTVIIDVREHSEIEETGKIPGSIHIPLGELANALGEMSAEEFKKKYNAVKPPKDTEIIFSCKSGNRSLKALRTGLELGFDKAGHFKGGWLEWAKKQGI